MLKFTKYTLYVLVFAFCSNIVLARGGIEFSAPDYDRAVRGEKNLSGVKLEGADFKGMDLRGVDFSEADLEGANFTNANLSGVNFEKTDLEGANLKGANIDKTIFHEAELEYTTWTNGRICGEGSIGGCW